MSGGIQIKRVEEGKDRKMSWIEQSHCWIGDYVEWIQ